MGSKNEEKILKVLEKESNPITVSQLAEKTSIDLSNITRYWKKLFNEGLITYTTEQNGKIRTTYLSLRSDPLPQDHDIEKKEDFQAFPQLEFDSTIPEIKIDAKQEVPKEKIQESESEILLMWKNKQNKVKSEFLRFLYFTLTGSYWRKSNKKLISTLRELLTS